MKRISDGFVAQAQQQPDKAAIVIKTPGQGYLSRTYGELLHNAQCIAATITETLSAIDLPPLDPAQPQSIALLLPNCLEFLDIFLGIILSGNTAMVLDPKWTEAQIQQILQQHSPLLLFNHPTHPPIHLSPSTLHSPFAQSQSFYVGFTSGTTGTPKGVIRSHNSWIASFAASQIEFGTSAIDRILVPGSLIHSLSLYAVLEGLNAGATVFLLPQFSAKAVLDCCQEQAISTLVAIPTLLRTIAKAIQRQGTPISNVKTVIAGGSKLEPDLRDELPQAFPAARILEYYGALELSFISLASSQESVPPTSVGRPFHGVEVSIRRPNDGSAASSGEVGYIAIKSPMLSSGYLNSIDPTGLRTIDGWATVGDMGWQDDNGYLYVAGREQDMVITSGMNIYPSEVESILCTFPEVDQVAVFGIPDVDRGQVLCAAIRWLTAPLSRTQLQQRLQSALPPAKHPRQFFSTTDFPTTHSGKIIRSALRDRVLQHHPTLQKIL